MRHNELGLREPKVRKVKRLMVKATVLAAAAVASPVGMALAEATRGRTGTH